MEHDPQYIHDLQHQHAEAVEDLLMRHMLWNPQLEHPRVPPTEPAFVTVIVLNDGRNFHVQTLVSDGGTKVNGAKLMARG